MQFRRRRRRHRLRRIRITYSCTKGRDWLERVYGRYSFSRRRFARWGVRQSGIFKRIICVHVVDRDTYDT